MKKVLLLLWLSIVSLSMFSAEQFISFTPLADYFPLIVNGQPCIIKCDSNIDKGVKIAIDNLQQDIFNVCLLYTSPSPRDAHESRMPSSA